MKRLRLDLWNLAFPPAIDSRQCIKSVDWTSKKRRYKSLWEKTRWKSCRLQRQWYQSHGFTTQEFGGSGLFKGSDDSAKAGGTADLQQRENDCLRATGWLDLSMNWSVSSLMTVLMSSAFRVLHKKSVKNKNTPNSSSTESDPEIYCKQRQKWKSNIHPRSLLVLFWCQWVKLLCSPSGRCFLLLCLSLHTECWSVYPPSRVCCKCWLECHS